MDNTVSTIKGDNYNIKNDNNIEYSVFYEEEGYISLENSTESIEKEKVESGKIKSYRKDHASWGGEVGWVETYAKYAYIDSQGNLVSNIDFINKFNESIASKNENIKYTKIIGDGSTFYILTESGEVYKVTYTKQTNEVDYMRDELGIEHEVLVDLDHTGGYYYNTVFKLYLKNIVNIYDSATALTKDGKIVSLIKNNEESTSIVQELQSQTDKYLIVSHLGLKDGKLYNFDDVRNGIEVTAGKLVESEEAKFGTYSKSNKTIELFSKYDEEMEKYNNEIYIDVQKSDELLPEFVDIAEYRDSYMSMLVSFNYTKEEDNLDRGKVIDYLKADPYALCYAISTDGEVWAYIGGCVIDTGVNLDFFGPTTNYTLSNTKWTNQNICLVYTENTTNKIGLRKVKKGEEIISEGSEVTIEKNGIYDIEVVDLKDRNYQTTLNVVNIDKIKPVIETEGKIKNQEVTLKAHDVEDTTGDYGI